MIPLKNFPNLSESEMINNSKEFLNKIQLR